MNKIIKLASFYTLVTLAPPKNVFNDAQEFAKDCIGSTLSQLWMKAIESGDPKLQAECFEKQSKCFSDRQDITDARLGNVETTVAGLSTTVAGLSTTVADLSTTVSGLSTTVAGLSARMSNVETTVAGLSTRMSNVETTVAGLSTTVAGLSDRIGKVEGKVDSLMKISGEHSAILAEHSKRFDRHENILMDLTRTVGSMNAKIDQLLIKK